MRSRHPSDYPSWSPLSQMSSPQWMNEGACDTSTSHVGSLPAAHNLLSFSKTSPSVLTNQNGKTFTTVGGGSYSSSRFTNPSFSSSTSHYDQSLPSPISTRSVDHPYTPLKREVGETPVPIAFSQSVSNGSLSTSSCISRWDKGVNDVRSVYSANTPASASMTMDFVEGRCPPGACDPTTASYPMNQGSKVFRSSTSSNACTYTNGDVQYANTAGSFLAHSADVSGEVLKPGQVGLNNGFNTRGTKYPTTRYSIGPDSTTGSAAASIVSSDGETTTSSSANRGTKKTRKPAPTLATGRRNLKSEPVDADEADRRLKRRERNRKSAQKCRERKLHRTQELQAQVDGLNAEANRLLREVESWRDQARRCVQLLQQHCPGVAIPYLTCLVDPPDIFLPLPESASTTTVAPNLPPPPPPSVAPAPPSFCDMSEPEVCFYKSRMQYDASTGTEAVGSPWHPSGASGPTTESGLPPMSHLVHNSQPPPRRQPSPTITVSTSSMRSFISAAAPGLEVSYSQSVPGAATGDPIDPSPAAPHRPCSLSAPTTGSYWATRPSPDEVVPTSASTADRDPAAWHVEAKHALSSSI